jgi:hypothetical protein
MDTLIAARTSRRRKHWGSPGFRGRRLDGGIHLRRAQHAVAARKLISQRFAGSIGHLRRPLTRLQPLLLRACFRIGHRRRRTLLRCHGSGDYKTAKQTRYKRTRLRHATSEIKFTSS